MSPISLTLVERLAMAPSRGLGPANQIAGEAQGSAEVLQEFIAALQDERSVVTIRAANALRKVQKMKPGLLVPHARRLLRAASECVDVRTRWNLTNIVGSLPLHGRDKALAVELLFEALGNKSGFLRTFAMNGLVNFAQNDDGLGKRVRPIVQNAMHDTSAAMRARARRLHKLLGADAR